MMRARSLSLTRIGMGPYTGEGGQNSTYFGVTLSPGVRVLVLDSFDIAVVGRDPDSSEYREAYSKLTKHRAREGAAEVLNWNSPKVEMKITGQGFCFVFTLLGYQLRNFVLV